ncbi:MAG TPA: D-alanyl-D-alanine carboxypeptidase/D-alanyl-D-alanine-endopeptidase [Candidatus Nanopelagicales bacterium]|nr:D-alanyl-D-alanine carboxypeptidase/D-alanyl-D-alanine-endopeptidase [Candidatus Nanopelagicales bacterium]
MIRRHLAALALAATVVLGAVPAGAAPAEPAPPPAPAAVLTPTAVVGATAPVPSERRLAKLLTPLLASPALGARTAVSVVDAATGTELYESFGGRAQIPASTTKLLTALAVLQALGPDARLTTRVVTGGRESRLVLVGGGDQTLARAPTDGGSAEGQRLRPASLDDLADGTVAALERQGRDKVSLRYDTSLFSGPATAPSWPSSYVASGVVSPVVALAVDGGRTGPGQLSRSSDPALTAAEYFAGRLRAAGVTVTGRPKPATAAAEATELAAVQSPTVADLVEHMLTVSDDDLAEGLAHLAGAAQGEGSFAGGAQATIATLRSLGVATTSTVLRDGSGLSRQDAVPPSVLTAALAAAMVPGDRTSGLWPVWSGLPVAGLTGTLADRFVGAAATGRGVVRAKTGTLTGVNALAGTVRDHRGRLLTFAVLTDGTVEKYAAQAQLDRIAAALASA